MPATKKDDGTIIIQPVKMEEIIVPVIGITPLIINRLSQKVQGELLLPKGRKTAADKASGLKHNPLEEFTNSPYTLKDGPTYLAVTSAMFKAAMRTAALDLPSTNKSQIGRLVWVQGEYTPIYVVPQLHMSVVRCADINRTPDIRTRAIVPNWAAVVTIGFQTPILNPTSILNLLSAAGMTAGVGDWRPEKGKGNFGQFRICNKNDPEFVSLLKKGRKVQEEAMDNPEYYDEDTERLMEWFNEEIKIRGKKIA